MQGESIDKNSENMQKEVQLKKSIFKSFKMRTCICIIHNFSSNQDDYHIASQLPNIPNLLMVYLVPGISSIFIGWSVQMCYTFIYY